jgi:hypothetical protein
MSTVPELGRDVHILWHPFDLKKYSLLLSLERIEKPKNFPMVVVICNEILRIVGSDYGTQPEFFTKAKF